MKSPFPGMDPYLERHWRDVHQRLCVYACDALQPQVRPALLARVDERLVVESEDEFQRSIYPDVRVVQRAPGGAGSNPSASVGIAEPLVFSVRNDPAYEGFIQIFDPSNGGRLVTVIEFLSKSNKSSKAGMAQYRQKQAETAEANVSLVEIDLLRGDEWVLQIDRSLVPRSLAGPYRACVRRGWMHDKLDYYHFSIRDRLPKLRIPLRQQDEQAILDLQELIDRIYFNGGYDSIDYSVPPMPPLDEADAVWAKEILCRPGPGG